VNDAVRGRDIGGGNLGVVGHDVAVDDLQLDRLDVLISSRKGSNQSNIVRDALMVIAAVL